LFDYCPVCKSKSFKALGKLNFALPDTYPIASKLTVLQCNKCGFVGSDSLANKDDYNNYYRQITYSSNYTAFDLDDDEIQYLDETIAIIQKHINTDDKILDIGCGLSHILSGLKNNKYKNLYALDMSKECVNYFKDTYQIDAIVGAVDNIPCNIKPDFIILSHIVEHLFELDKQLQYLKEQLLEGKKIFVEVPDTSRFEEFATNLGELSFFYYTHLLHFDEFHLQNVFEANGFTMLESGKRVRVEKCVKIPSIWAVFSNVDKYVFKCNFNLANKIGVWFDDFDSYIFDDLDNLVKTQKPVYVWGMGMHAHFLLGMTKLKDCNIVALLDKNPDFKGTHICGMEILSSDLLYNATVDDCVFICAQVNQSSMRFYLTETVGFKGEIITI